ncbi:hypothetical protein FNE71_30350 [Klebsiella pneumoniae]|nr:hypothetical protein FNE71_30350 [Klebsiella pneumoniae]
MGSKIFLLGLSIAFALLISSEVSARDVAETTTMTEGAGVDGVRVCHRTCVCHRVCHSVCHRICKCRRVCPGAEAEVEVEAEAEAEALEPATQVKPKN